MSLTALLVWMLALVAVPDDLPRSSIATKEFDKFAKDVGAYFTATEKDDRKGALDSLAKIRDAYDKLAKRAKLDDPLKYVGDWEQILERSKVEARELKGAAGKGFVRYVAAWDDVRVVCMVNVPAAYGKGDTFCPAIVALKPLLGMSGEVLEKEAAALATKAYGKLLETTIVVVPLGPERAAERKAEATEIEGSWMTDEGMTSLFYGVRVLLYDLKFDRSRMFLDGWKDAGLDAVMAASSFPSWFAGVINRSGEVGGPEVLYQNLGGSPLLYVEGGADARGADLQELRNRCDGITTVDVVTDAQTALEPTDEARARIEEWLGSKRRDVAPTRLSYMLGDIRFQSVAWIKAYEINRRSTAKPEDKDFPRLEAEIDRASNTIKIQSVNVLELFLFLNDGLVDLSKPVIVTVNGKERFNRAVPRDLRYMLDNRYYMNSGDYGVYTAEVLIDGIDPNVPKADAEPAAEPAAKDGGAPR
jgi:hypothetical protein